MIWSCSAPVSRVGAPSPAAAAASRMTSKAKELAVRAIGPSVGASMRAARRSRSAVALCRVAENTTICSGDHPRACTRCATSSTRVAVLPEPGAPTTTALMSSARSTTARCESSRFSGAFAAASAGSGGKVTMNQRYRDALTVNGTFIDSRCVVICVRGHKHRYQQQPP